MVGEDESVIPDSGAVFTFGKSRFADNIASHFFIRNDPVIDVACGDEHTVIICQNGRTFAFGKNDWGQLGLGHRSAVSKPSCIKSLKPETAVMAACGRTHTLIATGSGKVFACGSNGNGELGVGDTDDRDLPAKVVNLEGDRIISIAAGCHHSFAVTSLGKVFGWGSNSDGGQLGLGKDVTGVPQPILLSVGCTIRQVACGYYHTLFLADDGRVFSCGEYESGKLGLGEGGIAATPQVVTMQEETAAVAAGGGHSIAVTVDGKAYGWGSNSRGQLGMPPHCVAFYTPTLIADLADYNITTAACGDNHTAFITAEGEVLMCGEMRHGKLGWENYCSGGDAEVFQSVPTIVPRFIGFTVTRVACGGCHTLVVAKPRNTESQPLNGQAIDVIELTSSVSSGRSTLPPLQKFPLSRATSPPLPLSPILLLDDSLHEIDSDPQRLELDINGTKKCQSPPTEAVSNACDELDEKVLVVGVKKKLMSNDDPCNFDEYDLEPKGYESDPEAKQCFPLLQVDEHRLDIIETYQEDQSYSVFQNAESSKALNEFHEFADVNANLMPNIDLSIADECDLESKEYDGDSEAKDSFPLLQIDEHCLDTVVINQEDQSYSVFKNAGSSKAWDHFHKKIVLADVNETLTSSSDPCIDDKYNLESKDYECDSESKDCFPLLQIDAHHLDTDEMCQEDKSFNIFKNAESGKMRNNFHEKLAVGGIKEIMSNSESCMACKYDSESKEYNCDLNSKNYSISFQIDGNEKYLDTVEVCHVDRSYNLYENPENNVDLNGAQISYDSLRASLMALKLEEDVTAPNFMDGDESDESISSLRNNFKNLWLSMNVGDGNEVGGNRQMNDCGDFKELLNSCGSKCCTIDCSHDLCNDDADVLCAATLYENATDASLIKDDFYIVAKYKLENTALKKKCNHFNAAEKKPLGKKSKTKKVQGLRSSLKTRKYKRLKERPHLFDECETNSGLGIDDLVENAVGTSDMSGDEKMKPVGMRTCFNRNNGTWEFCPQNVDRPRTLNSQMLVPAQRRPAVQNCVMLDCIQRARSSDGDLPYGMLPCQLSAGTANHCACCSRSKGRGEGLAWEQEARWQSRTKPGQHSPLPLGISDTEPGAEKSCDGSDPSSLYNQTATFVRNNFIGHPQQAQSDGKLTRLINRILPRRKSKSETDNGSNAIHDDEAHRKAGYRSIKAPPKSKMCVIV